jgi:hypothetical protein
LDAGKILFGTLFLDGVLRGEVEPFVTVIAGIGTAMLFFVFGIWLTTKKNDKGVTDEFGLYVDLCHSDYLAAACGHGNLRHMARASERRIPQNPRTRIGVNLTQKLRAPQFADPACRQSPRQGI